MALGSAFFLYGSVGGWSRTLFLLAHELPQEIGDFGNLLRSGFGVSKALFFNFLSALVALAGTALALLLGHEPGYSSVIEGFTAGGFIYIAVAGALAGMNNNEKTSVRTSIVHSTTLVMGMGVALWDIIGRMRKLELQLDIHAYYKGILGPRPSAEFTTVQRHQCYPPAASHQWNLQQHHNSTMHQLQDNHQRQ